MAIKDILQQAMTGGALGGMGKTIMDALKKRKKAIPKAIPTPMREPIKPGLKAIWDKKIKEQKGEIKLPREMRDLKKQKRWAY